MTSSPRCLVRGCPVVYRSGDDRPCPIHADEDGDTMAARMETFADLAAPPGESDGDGGRPAASNPDRPHDSTVATGGTSCTEPTTAHDAGSQGVCV